MSAVIQSDREASLRAKITQLVGEIERLESEQADYQNLLNELRSPFKTGDLITWERNGRGRVIQSKLWVGDLLCWEVRVIRKDGSEGQIRDIRDYMNPVKL